MMLKKRALKNLMLSLFAMVIVGFTKSEVAHANPNATISDFSLSRTTAYLEESEGGYVFLTGKTPATGQYEYSVKLYFNGEYINNMPFAGGTREIQLPIWKRQVGTGYYEVSLVEYNEEWSEAVSTKVLGRLSFEIKPQKVVEPTPEPTPPTTDSGTSNSGSSSNTGSSNSNSGTSNSGSSSNTGSSNSNSGTSNSGSSSNTGSSNSNSGTSNSGSSSNTGSSNSNSGTSNSGSSSNTGSSNSNSGTSNSGSSSNTGSSNSNSGTSNSGSSSNTGSSNSNSGTSNSGSSNNDSDKEEQTDESVKDEVVTDEEAKDEVVKDEIIEGDDEEELSTKLWGKPSQQSSKSNLPMVIALSTVGVTGLGISGYVGYMTYIKKQPLNIKFKKEWLKFKKRK